VHGVEELHAGEEELRRSRAHVVAAADAERRRIERQLHDGPQQRLVALSVELQRARLLAAEGPPELVELMEALGAEVRAALAELRDLAERIYPPLLEGQALATSVRAAAARAAIPVEVEVAPLGRLSEPVAAAVYLCCLDALENAVTHAGPGSRVRVVLARDDDGIRFEVADDGPGFDTVATASGAGLARIADRVGALGGRVSVESSPGRGARLIGEIPVGP
jgi:signal transduction histidine kinase